MEILIILGIAGASIVLWRYLSKRIEQPHRPPPHKKNSLATAARRDGKGSKSDR